MQGPGNYCKVLDETTVVTGESQELLYITLRLGLRPRSNLTEFCRISSNSLGRDHMTKKCNFSSAKLALAQVEFQSSTSEAIKHILQILQVVLKALSGYNNIIQIN
jgi:hypothetical protein